MLKGCINFTLQKEVMQFGRLSYNDVQLTKEDFSIDELKNDTGYEPQDTFEDTVKELYDYFLKFRNFYV